MQARFQRILKIFDPPKKRLTEKLSALLILNMLNGNVFRCVGASLKFGRGVICANVTNSCRHAMSWVPVREFAYPRTGVAPA